MEEKDGNLKHEDGEQLEKEFRLQMEEMKEKYKRIQVPETAKERMLAGIREAKAEMKKQEEEQIRQKAEVISMKERKEKTGPKKNRLWLRRTAVAAAAAIVAVGTLANVSPVTASAMEKLPIIGTLARVMTFRTFEDNQGNFSSRVDIPKIDSENGTEVAANKDIEEYAESLIAQYEADLKASGGEGHYSLDSTYDVVSQNDQYVSIRISTTLAMASGVQYVKVFTVDKATGSVVTLKEITKEDPALLEKIGENIKSQMRDQMAADENIAYFIDSEMPEMDFQGLTGEESFYFDGNGQMVIYFDEYQVAPGYMGAVSFTIPAEVTGELSR